MIALKILWSTFLFGCCFEKVVTHAVIPDCSDSKFNPSTLTLCQELQRIRDLAPESSVIRLVQTHMENDSRFRRAVKYMMSDDFKKTTARIDATAQFQSLLEEFEMAGVNTTDLNSIFKIFDCLLLPVLKNCRSSSLPTNHLPESKSLVSFAQEVSNLISTDELVDLLETLVSESSNFASFYEIVRDSSFRSKVMSGFNNRAVSYPVKRLRHYQIDLAKLVEYTFNLLYLGPDV